MRTCSSHGRHASWRFASPIAVVLVLTACGGGSSPPDPALGACLDSTTLTRRVQFANAEQAAALLSRPDDWSMQLSAFERSARRRTVEPTTEEELLEHLSRQGVDWTSEERSHWGGLVERLGDALAGLGLAVPELALVQSTGLDEFGAAYSRPGAIVLPEPRIDTAEDERADFFLLAHELAHAVSWSDPHLRDDLYSLLGFERFDGFTPPPELGDRRLSNPGGHTYDHALLVNTPDGPTHVVPFVRSSAPLEEVIGLPAAGSAFFEVLEILLLPVDVDTGEPVRGTDGELVTYGFDDTDWPARMGRNTSYIIHPEEVIADNVASLIEWRSTAVTPTDNPSGFPVNDVDLLRSIEEVLAAGCG